MKMIDREGRLFGKISVIDLLVIAVVAVMAVALRVKNTKTPTGSNVETQPIAFQIRVVGAETYLADAIQVGDSVYDTSYASGNGPVGKITQVEVLNDPGIIMSDCFQNGTLVPMEVEGTVDLIVTIEGSGVVTDRTYSINRVYELGMNASRTYRSNKVTFAGAVINIMT